MGISHGESQDSLSRVVGNTKLNFEEISTVLCQIEVCMNSRLMGTLPHNNDEGITVLTPGHFFIDRPLEVLPDRKLSHQPISVLRQW